jgi:hypothetical protein
VQLQKEDRVGEEKRNGKVKEKGCFNNINIPDDGNRL